MTSPLGPLAGWPRHRQWLLLLAGSGVLAFLLEMCGLPAALLLGPMIAGVVLGCSGATVRPPRVPYLGAQAVVGCLIARAMTPDILVSFAADWPLFAAVVFSTLAASSFLGWLISRWSVLPGTTAIWGSSPGAATAMMLMAEAFGADARLVAFMQYLRVVFVATAASVIARLWVDTSGAAIPAVVWFPPIDWIPFGQTIALALAGGALGRALKLPAGAMLVPLAIGSVLNSLGLITIFLPPWLLAMSYALLGWNIGLGFTLALLRHAARALPQIVASILALMLFCGGMAYLLHRVMGINPLTAYLATSPGGMDSVAIIAASSNVDLSFVMALQIARFLLVLLAGPPLARFLARRVG
jgi:hypothetical protein